MDVQQFCESIIRHARHYVYELHWSGALPTAKEIIKVLSLTDSVLAGPQSIYFYDTLLDQLNITPTSSKPFLLLKSNISEHIAARSSSYGRNELWSSEMLYHHLNTLENLVATPRTASPHGWIYAFLLRASAMVPPDKRMVLIAEDPAPATITSLNKYSTSFAGFANYTAVIADPMVADKLLDDPFGLLQQLNLPTFFVIESKADFMSDDQAQALYKMYECGKFLQRGVVRGALTNGHEWMFIIVKFDNDYNGASYRWTKPIELQVTSNHRPYSHEGKEMVIEPSPDLIAGILLHWIENASSDIQSDDWFKL